MALPWPLSNIAAASSTLSLAHSRRCSLAKGRKSRGRATAAAAAAVAAVLAAALTWAAASHGAASVAGLLKDWHLRGEVGGDGWQGTATYKLEGGHSLKLGAAGEQTRVTQLEAAVGYQACGPEPNVELAATVKPGTKALRYRARLSKSIDAVPSSPIVAASFTNGQALVETSLKKDLPKGVGVSAKLQLPYSYGKRAVAPALLAETSYDVAGGRLVGTVVTNGPSGGTRWAARFTQL